MPKYLATLLGFAFENPTKEFTVRTGPGTSFDKTDFLIAKGTADMPVLDIEEDVNDVKSDYGRTYNWFHLQFPNGKTGWMRGHVIGIVGDFTDYGYGVVDEMTHAYKMDRDETKTGPAPLAPGQEVAQTGDSSNALVAAAQGSEATAPETASTTSDSSSALVAAAQGSTPAPAEPTNLLQADAQATQTRPIVNLLAADASHAVTSSEPAVETAAAEVPTGPALAVIKAKSGIRPRMGPSTVGYDRASFALPTLAKLEIMSVARENRGQHLRWYKVNYQGTNCWVREDFCRYEGGTDSLGLPSDVYPSPMGDKAWWVRDYNRKPDFDDGTWEHWGWDFGANTGQAMTCGPNGGVVVQTMDCSKCTPSKPSTVMNGISLGDNSVYKDPGWGFGYGNFVVVGYKHDILPASTQATLTQKGYPGGSLFVLYGHMQKRAVNTGDVLKPNQTIGACGNSGNSEATHLHLEVRMSKTDKYDSWAALGSKSLASPVILFNR